MSDPEQKQRNTLNAWLRLIRLPNLFTVPGDCVLGFLLATASVQGTHSPAILIWVLLSSLFLYISGLFMNDFLDIKEDKQNRKNRPLATGEISKYLLSFVLIALIICALQFARIAGISSFVISAILLIAILGYNFLHNKNRKIAPWLMASCRGLNILLGASIVPNGWFKPAVLIAATVWLIYIWIISTIAIYETDNYKQGNLRWLPILIFALATPPMLVLFKNIPKIPLLFWFGATTLWLLYASSHLTIHAKPQIVQQCVGKYIRGLILLQATFAIITGIHPYLISAIAIFLWLGANISAKKFYES